MRSLEVRGIGVVDPDGDKVRAHLVSLSRVHELALRGRLIAP